MEHPLRFFANAKRSPLDPAQSSDDLRLAQAAQQDLQLVRMPRVNLLVSGREGVVQRILESLFTRLQAPITIWSPGQPLVLPPPGRGGTLILHEVGSLSVAEQARLLDWIGHSSGRTQVVSTTTTPLLPRVETKAFADKLYYRLNVVCVDTLQAE